VNYNAAKVPSLAPVPVVCRLPKGQTAKGVTVYSPDAGGPQTVEVKAGAAGASFAVPVKTYAIAVIKW
jgi:hypothetical protein